MRVGWALAFQYFFLLGLSAFARMLFVEFRTLISSVDLAFQFVSGAPYVDKWFRCRSVLVAFNVASCQFANLLASFICVLATFGFFVPELLFRRHFIAVWRFLANLSALRPLSIPLRALPTPLHSPPHTAPGDGSSRALTRSSSQAQAPSS